LEEARQKTPLTKMMEGEMFNKSQLPWSNDPLVLMLIGVSTGASIALYFIAVHGWSW
jgi:hypothetical protein